MSSLTHSLRLVAAALLCSVGPGSAAAQSPDLRPASDVDLGPAIAAVGERAVVAIHASGVPWSFHAGTVMLHSDPPLSVAAPSTRLAPTADNEALWAFAFVGDQVCLSRVEVVAAALEQTPVTCQDQTPLLDLDPQAVEVTGPLHALQEWPDGRVCATNARAFLCLDPTDPTAPLEVTHDSAGYAAALPAFDPPPQLLEVLADDSRVPALSYLDAIWIDDRFVVLADLELRPAPHGKPVTYKDVQVSARFLFEEHSDGSLHMRTRPAWVSRNIEYPTSYSPVTYVERLFHWREHDLIGMWPSRPVDHCWLDPDQVGLEQPVSPYASPRSNPLGQRGQGYALVPLDSDGLGQLAMHHAFHRTMRCHYGAYAGFEMCFGATGGGPLVTPAGSLVHGVGHLDATEGAVLELHPVNADFDALDLDGDRLRGAAERALGTSDFLSDSDGGGDSDGAESGLLGGDPLDPTDDRQRHTLGEVVHYSPSEFIRLRLPDKGPRVPARTWGVVGPLCAGGECFDAAGRVVATYDGSDGILASRSVDGRAIWNNRKDGIDVTRLADGRVRRVLDRETVIAAFKDKVDGPLPVTVVPVDEDRAWLISVGAPARVAYFDGEQLSVRYDGDTVRCDNLMGPCEAKPFPTAVILDRVTAANLPFVGGSEPPVGPPAFAPDINPDELLLMGYEPVSERLLITVYGSWDVFEIALHATDAALVQRDASKMRVADDPSDGIFSGHIPTPAAQWQPTGFGDRYTAGQIRLPGGAGRASAVQILAGQSFALGAWGDTLAVWGNSVTGPVELVRALAGEADPGDVLVYAGGPLYRSTRRGGLFPVYDPPQLGGRPFGLGVSPAGRVCLVGSGHYVELEADPFWGGAPRLEVNEGFVSGAVECEYDADGVLHLLVFAAGGDGSVYKVSGGALVDTGIAQIPGPPSDGSQLIRTPDGDLAVVGRGMDVVGEQPPGTPALSVPGPSRFGPLVVRPDGIVIASEFYGVVAFDPATEEVVSLSPIEFADRPLLGRLPGGDARDPWPGSGLDEGVLGSAVGEGSEPTEPTEPQTGPAAGDAGGCAAPGPTSGGHWFFALAGWCLLWWRRVE